MAVIYSLHPTNDCTTLQAHRQCQYLLPICLLWALILFSLSQEYVFQVSRRGKLGSTTGKLRWVRGSGRLHQLSVHAPSGLLAFVLG